MKNVLKYLPGIIPPFLRNVWERDNSGTNWYYVNNEGEYGEYGGNLAVAQNHPILTPAMLFVSKLFSQAEFYMKNKTTGEKVYSHWMLDLLRSPNYYQTQNDFLESLMFMMIAQGVAVGLNRKITGMEEAETIYLLDICKIEWPEGFRTKLSARNETNPIRNKYVVYDRNGENLRVQIKDLIFFYDLPNGMNTRQMFKNCSRLDGLKQTLINTNDSLVAKNIILKSNGKELITGDKDGFNLSEEEKIDAQNLFNSGYGLSKKRSRGLITKANIKWQSLHIALRDLGLDESVKVDGNLIYTALHIPKDILSLEAKKTTYNNYKESMVSYIQNEMQSSINSICAVLNKTLNDNNLELVGSYEHLPVMQFINKEKYEGIEQRGLALQALRDAGLPDEIALELCGFDKNIELEENVQTTNTNTQETTSTNNKGIKKLKVS
jgi:HK97 family phage portal protein